MNEMNEITINGTVYVPKDEMLTPIAVNTAGLTYCVIRTYSAGVHTGYLKERNGKEVTLVNARRIWYWSGAFTLSAMAVDGVSKPDECKFSRVVPEIILTEAIEIIPCTEKAKNIIEGVKVHECKN